MGIQRVAEPIADALETGIELSLPDQSVIAEGPGRMAECASSVRQAGKNASFCAWARME